MPSRLETFESVLNSFPDQKSGFEKYLAANLAKAHPAMLAFVKSLDPQLETEADTKVSPAA